MRLLKEEVLEACSIKKNDKPLAAVSGGADSVAMLTELARLRDEGRISGLHAAHIHHGIRGDEADRDLRFTCELCKKLNVPLSTVCVDVPAFAKESGRSMEWAARTLRYRELYRLQREQDCSCIALAHHMGDRAETLLLNLIRGSGTGGLASLKSRNGALVRPLLGVEKGEIIAFLEECNQPWCEDSTNGDDDYRRNAIRLRLLPELARYNPSIVRGLNRTAELVREDEDFLQVLASREYERCGGERFALAKLPKPLLSRILLKLLWEQYDSVDGREVEMLTRLLSAQAGTTIDLKEGKVAWVDAHRLYLGNPPAAQSYDLPLEPGHSVSCPQGRISCSKVSAFTLPPKTNTAYINELALKGGLHVRNARQGDRFTPFGMKGSRLLSDYLGDRGLGRYERMLPVVYDDAGIVYVAGHCIDERFRLDADSAAAIMIKYEEDV